MYCSNCGAEITQDSKFCSACGHEISAAAQPVSNEMGVTSAASHAPTKKMALWKKLAIGTVAAIILIVGLSIYLTAPLTEPVDRQITALMERDLLKAYDQTSQAFKDATSYEQFVSFIEARPILLKVVDYSFPEREWENNIGTLRGSLETAEGGVIPVAYQLVKENGEWKILSISFDKEDVAD